MTADIGVLALQGDFAAHVRTLGVLGARARAVRRPVDLAALDGLVLPGGESTALLTLMNGEDWFGAIRALHRRGGALLGTCAGAILLAREVVPAQPSLGLLDAVVERNGFGRQQDSFEGRVDAAEAGDPLTALFIRAPRLRALGGSVEVLGRLDGEPVLVRQGRVLAATFHPELTGATGLHRLFLETAEAGVRGALHASLPALAPQGAA